MSPDLRRVFLRTRVRVIFFSCLIILAFSAPIGCGGDSTLSTGGAQSEQDESNGDPQRDAGPADDTQNDEDQSSLDTQDSSDAPHNTDAQDDGDATNPDASADAEDGADVQDSSSATSCNDNQDCQASGGICIEPGGFVGCGSCQNYLVSCTEDSQCASGSSGEISDDMEGRMICERVGPEDCACDPDISICKPACQENSDCKTGQHCAQDGRCAATPCSTGRDDQRACPQNFKCQPAVFCEAGDDCSSTCQRIACDQDSECAPGGVCVNGACHPELGTCQLPLP